MLFCVLISTKYNRQNASSIQEKKTKDREGIKIGDEPKNREVNQKKSKRKKEQEKTIIINNFFFSIV